MDNSKKNYEIFFMIIGVLILVIISLVLTLFNKGFNVFPRWIVESAMLGSFTLVGAALGAYLAGKFAAETTKQYFKHNIELIEKEKLSKTKNALKIALHFISDLNLAILIKVARFSNNIEKYELHDIKRELNTLLETVMKFETMLFDSQYLINVSSDSSRSIFSTLNMQLSLLKETIREIENLNEISSSNFVELVNIRLSGIALLLQQCRSSIEKILEE